MTNRLNNLKKAAATIRMSEAEKSAMRTAIFGAPSPLPVTQSPYVFASFFSYQTRMAMAGLLLFVLVGTGTASAAQGALPGDLLYPIKVGVTEKVEIALAGDTASKAAVETKLAARRVEEAEALAAAGKLDAATSETIAAKFDAHVDAANALADEADAGSPGTATEVKTTLASSLRVHGEILSKLGRGSKNQSTKEHSEALSVRVIARAEGPARAAAEARTFAAAPASQAKLMVVENSNEDATATLSIAAEAPQDPAQAKAAAALEEKATAVLTNAKKALEARKEKLASSTVEDLQKEFAVANAYMSAGATALGNADYRMAIDNFTHALGLGVRLSALIRAEEKLDNDLIPSLLNRVLDAD